jgi:hypothetical protein
MSIEALLEDSLTRTASCLILLSMPGQAMPHASDNNTAQAFRIARALFEREYIRLAIHATWLSEDDLLMSTGSARMSTFYLGVLVLDVHETHDTIRIAKCNGV